MTPTSTALAADWLTACRTAAQGLREVLLKHPTSRERVVETGDRGEGGDLTLVIDQQAEDAVFAQLDAMHEAGANFTAISEERGVVEYGGGDVRVVIDPLDGSLNAKRGMRSYALSIAVADGPTMGDVFFGYVYDFGFGEEWTARLGEGAYLDGRQLVDPPPERRMDDGRLELITIESSDPQYMAPAMGGLSEHVHRVRGMGSIAISCSQLAATRCDGFMTLWRTRAVDIAAAQLIVRETGALVAYPYYDDPLSHPLDLTSHSAVVAARSQDGLDRLLSVLR